MDGWGLWTKLTNCQAGGRVAVRLFWEPTAVVCVPLLSSLYLPTQDV